MPQNFVREIKNENRQKYIWLYVEGCVCVCGGGNVVIYCFASPAPGENIVNKYKGLARREKKLELKAEKG